MPNAKYQLLWGAQVRCKGSPVSILASAVSQALGETPSSLENTHSVRKKTYAKYFYLQLFCVVEVEPAPFIPPALSPHLPLCTVEPNRIPIAFWAKATSVLLCAGGALLCKFLLLLLHFLLLKRYMSWLWVNLRRGRVGGAPQGSVFHGWGVTGRSCGACHRWWWLCSSCALCLLQPFGWICCSSWASRAWLKAVVGCFEGRQCLCVLLVALQAGDTRHRGSSIPSLWSCLQNPRGSLTVTVTNFLLCFFPFFPPFV